MKKIIINKIQINNNSWILKKYKLKSKNKKKNFIKNLIQSKNKNKIIFLGLQFQITWMKLIQDQMSKKWYNKQLMYNKKINKN